MTRPRRLRPNGIVRVVLVAAALVAVAAATRWRAAAILAAVAGATAVTSLWAMRRVRVDVNVRAIATRVQRGNDVPIEVTLTNHGRRPVRDLLVDVEGAGRTETAAFARVAPREPAEQRVVLASVPRGHHRVTDAVVVRRDMFDLLRIARRVPCATSFIVHPFVSIAAAAGITGHRAYGDGTDVVPDGLDFDWIRPWRPGDSLRHVHWLTTARSGDVMVRTFVDPAADTVTVLLDVAAEAYRDADEFEAAVDLAASYCAAAVRSGLRTTLTTTSGRRWSGHGRGAERDLLDALAVVTVVPPGQPRAASFAGVGYVVTGGTPHASAFTATIAEQSPRVSVRSVRGSSLVGAP